MFEVKKIKIGLPEVFTVDQIYEFQIKLEYPQEFITKVSGNYGPADDPEGEPIFYFVNTDSWVRSLTFESNLQKIYGPYGIERGRSFSFTTEGNKIVGLMGRSDRYLDAIGFRLSTPVVPSKNPFKNAWTTVRSMCIPSQGKPPPYYYFFMVQ